MQRPGNANSVDSSTVKVRDIRGYEIFSHGTSGEALTLAHRLADTAHWRLGHHLLGEWLATHSGQHRRALTDTPALLWRLALSAPQPVALHWEPMRRTALAYMHDTPDPFVQLHRLLALAGAGDTSGIEHWLRTDQRFANTKQQRVMERFALALWALSSDAYLRAADLLHAVLPDLPLVGGSQAQNQLFGQLAALAAQQARNASPVSTYRHAA
jgi:hypothetical protein